VRGAKIDMTALVRGQRPDLTPAQAIGVIVGGIPVIASLLRAFGVYEASPEQEQALQNAVTWGVAAAGLLFASDAGLRAARNVADARRDAAALSAPGAPRVAVEGAEEAELAHPDETAEQAAVVDLHGPHTT
jgi:hypothetical protein